MKKILKCLLIDSNVNSLRETTRLIGNHPNLEIVNSCKTGRSAYSILSDTKVDLIFMNPALPDANGFDLVQSMEDPPLVVILSDRPDYAFFAFRIDAVDYRLKPLTSENLEETLERVDLRLRMKAAIQTAKD